MEHQRGPIGHKRYVVANWPQLGSRLDWRNTHGGGSLLMAVTPALKFHKCGSTSHLANTCTKKKKINEVQVIEEAQCTQATEESKLDSAVSEDIPVEDYPIENITAFFEVTEVHNHLPQ
ncbi:hypothetical protein O181_024134 [Austropuccinia psidii MF-1]|uniref:Uncharacterized protein n=1 Tax=Austropuccinia psidii MF-1 TaxID=1389203 RepID=A0A9Q3GZD0_9BASI|nr:hypothetical protein [Austropuccinia psidii MF-1]